MGSPEPEDRIAEQLALIQAKLNTIAGELAVIRRQREEMEDLKEDLTRIAKDLFNSAVEELEDVAPFVKTGDFLFLTKKLIRNTNNLTRIMERLESAADFLEDARPIAKELFQDALMKLQMLDEKGYFEYLRESTKIADNVVAHFSVDDLRMLAENVVAILETIKTITQPEMLDTLNNAVSVYKNLNIADPPRYSLWRAFREMNDPAMQRSLGMFITLMKNLNQQSIPEQHSNRQP